MKKRTPLQPDAEKEPKDQEHVWVKAEKIARLFDCSVASVYDGKLGLHKIPCVNLNADDPDTERPAGRYYWPAAVAHSKGLLQEWLDNRKRDEESLKNLWRFRP